MPHERTVDDRLKQLLRELGDAINQSVSSSSEVNQKIQKIRDQGYDLFVFLDATIGLGSTDESAGEPVVESGPMRQIKQPLALPGVESQFRINVSDLAFLRSVGIDPTRKVRPPRKS